MDQLPNISPNSSDYMMLRLLLQDAMLPLIDRLAKLEAKLDSLDDKYARRDVLDQRLKPLEEAALTKNQRIGVIVSGALGAISVIINLFSHMQLR